MRLALGTAQFGIPYGIANHNGQVVRSEVKAILKLGLANGLDMIDTAISYGESEACLGQIGVRDFNVVTKLPALPDNCRNVSNWVQHQVVESLLRLGENVAYGLLIHSPEQLLGAKGDQLYRAVQKLKEKGLVEKVGISIYSPNILDLLIPQYRFDLVQAPFNLVDRRLHNSRWLHRLKDDGIEIHTRSVFLQGLLLMEEGYIPSNFSIWTNIWHKWHKWLFEHDKMPLKACLDFPLSFPEIDRVIVGVDSKDQLAQIMNAVKFSSTYELPNLQCEDERLINPANWSKL
jgi:aryl-alcohol dehydrogenase-like predicted oxidoreductase